MKRFTLTLICLSFVSLFAVRAQQQVNNSGFETWDSIGPASGGIKNEEPVEWNSFKTASGSLALYGSIQIQRSTLTRPGSTGSYSCVIWSKSILGVIANGLVSTGQINMGAMAAASDSNYNITRTALPAFSEALGGHPDSLLVWVRFKPANAGGNDSARLHVTIHDTYDVRDPANTASAAHIVGEATKNFRTAYNLWTRLSVPFIYAGPATSPDFILISLTTNKTPGAGAGGDSLYVDDMSLIYNDAGVKNNDQADNFSVYSDANDIIIGFSFEKPTLSDIAIYNMNGQLVYNNRVTATSTIEKINSTQFNKGIYLVSIVTENGQRFARKIAIK
jgi:hypothetical protein